MNIRKGGVLAFSQTKDHFMDLLVILDIIISSTDFLFIEWVIGRRLSVSLRDTSLDWRLVYEFKIVVDWLADPDRDNGMHFATQSFSGGNVIYDLMGYCSFTDTVRFARSSILKACRSEIMLSRHSSSSSLVFNLFLRMYSSSSITLSRVYFLSRRSFLEFSTDFMFFRQPEIYLTSWIFSLTLFILFLCQIAMNLAYLPISPRFYSSAAFRFTLICRLVSCQIYSVFLQRRAFVATIDPCIYFSLSESWVYWDFKDSSFYDDWGFFIRVSSSLRYRLMNQLIYFLTLTYMGLLLRKAYKASTFPSQQMVTSQRLARAYYFPNWQIQYLRFLIFLLVQQLLISISCSTSLNRISLIASSYFLFSRAYFDVSLHSLSLPTVLSSFSLVYFSSMQS